jgi:crossover junction endodeoxyribonuclease RusA
MSADTKFFPDRNVPVIFMVTLYDFKLISLNDRTHWRAKANQVSTIRSGVKLRAHSVQMPKGLKRIRVEMHYIPKDKRRRDPLNLVATLKPIEDGLVDYGLIPDDTPEFLDSVMPIIDPPQKVVANSRVYLIITDLSNVA